MDYLTLTLPQIYDEAEAIARDAQTLFGHLGAQQLNWKPAADSWSVGQCLDHLIAINRAYYPTFDQILKGRYPRTWRHRLPFLPGLFGRVMIKALSPVVRQKYKSPGPARPSASSIDPSIVARFITQQHETLARMKSLENHKPARTIITSPFSNVIVYSLLDTFRLIVAHERRHFAQAERVLETRASA